MQALICQEAEYLIRKSASLPLTKRLEAVRTIVDCCGKDFRSAELQKLTHEIIAAIETASPVDRPYLIESYRALNVYCPNDDLLTLNSRPSLRTSARD